VTRAIAKQKMWEPGTNLRAWLFTIMHNLYINEVRRASREGVPVAIEDAAPALTVKPNALPSLELRDLDRAMHQLPESQRQVILLVGLEGMSYEQVAAVMDTPVGTVRSRLSRGRDALRSLMGVANDDFPSPPRAAA
jgi:RNA polymerase sigma-70 factor (ECF subfamily)